MRERAGVSLPLTGIEAGLLTTTTSSSMWTMVIGSAVTGTSCLQHKHATNTPKYLFYTSQFIVLSSK